MLKVTADGESPPQLSGGRRGVDPAQLWYLWRWFSQLYRIKRRTLHIISHTEKLLNIKSALKTLPDKLLHEVTRRWPPSIGLEALRHQIFLFA